MKNEKMFCSLTSDVTLNNRKAIIGPSTSPTRTFADKCTDSVSASPLTQAFCHMAQILLRCLVFRHAGGGCHLAKSHGEIQLQCLRFPSGQYCERWPSPRSERLELLRSCSQELISHANCPTAHAGANHYRPGGSCIASTLLRTPVSDLSYRISTSTCISSHHGSYQKGTQQEIPFWGLRFRDWEMRD